MKKQAKPFGFACLIIIFDNELVFFVNLSLSSCKSCDWHTEW